MSHWMSFVTSSLSVRISEFVSSAELYLDTISNFIETLRMDWVFDFCPPCELSDMRFKMDDL